jgi:hypothetical protein
MLQSRLGRAACAVRVGRKRGADGRRAKGSGKRIRHAQPRLFIVRKKLGWDLVEVSVNPYWLLAGLAAGFLVAAGAAAAFGLQKSGSALIQSSDG